MKIEANITALKRTKWQDYLVRFIFGGAVTALAGIIAKRYGPEIGGLFLATPAIFPAAATLLEKHEEKKARMRSGRALRAHELAGVDAAGAAMGSIGLAAFAAVVWQLLPRYPVALVLGAATLVWFAVAVAMWLARKILWRSLRATIRKRSHHPDNCERVLRKQTVASVRRQQAHNSRLKRSSSTRLAVHRTRTALPTPEYHSGIRDTSSCRVRPASRSASSGYSPAAPRSNRWQRQPIETR